MKTRSQGENPLLMVLGCCDDDQAGGLPLQVLPHLLQHQGLHFPHLGHTGSTCESFVPTVLPGWKPGANYFLKQLILLTFTVSLESE